MVLEQVLKSLSRLCGARGKAGPSQKLPAQTLSRIREMGERDPRRFGKLASSLLKVS